MKPETEIVNRTQNSVTMRKWVTIDELRELYPDVGELFRSEAAIRIIRGIQAQNQVPKTEPIKYPEEVKMDAIEAQLRRESGE